MLEITDTERLDFMIENEAFVDSYTPEVMPLYTRFTVEIVDREHPDGQRTISGVAFYKPREAIDAAIKLSKEWK